MCTMLQMTPALDWFTWGRSSDRGLELTQTQHPRLSVHGHHADAVRHHGDDDRASETIGAM